MSSTLSALLLSILLLAPNSAQAKGVILNFTDVDIATMVKFISDLTGKNFVMDERVKGKISVYSPSRLSSEEAFNVFTSVLELKGFTLIQAGKVYKVVPLAAAKQAGTHLYSDNENSPVNESYVARVITLENIPVQDALTFLQPTVSKDGHLSAFGPANMLLVVDSSLNIQKVLDILKIIDTEKKWDAAEIIYLKNAGADNIAKIIQERLGSRSQKTTGQPAQSSFGTTVLADSRLSAIFIFGSDKDKEEIRKFVTQIDVPPPNSSSKVNFYPLENSDATEMAKVLDSVVKGAATAQSQQGQQGSAPQQSPFDAGKVTITADKANNALIIMASPNDYQNLLQVIQKMDKARRQVFVQAIIAEVSLEKLQELGVQWGFFGGGSTTTVATAGIYDPSGTFSTLTNTLSALSSSGVSNSNLSLNSPLNFTVVLKALQSNDILNVLSSPTILTSDNKEAEIFVGENVPFLGTSTTSNGTTQQSVDRKDTGITLKITPQINEGDFIRLDIVEEISSVKDTVTIGSGSTDRTTTKRSAKTSVVVKNMETVVIGGLINESDQEVVSKVPLLAEIPLLGWLFKTKSMKKKKTNLILLLTPQVVRDEHDLADATSRQRGRFTDGVNREEKLDILKQVK
ncbi:MAG: type II secretion system secretin GspD [Geobacteraceae bacterium]|nr:type II secretion system secretin GspD [Geobacteraceae bacterium]